MATTRLGAVAAAFRDVLAGSVQPTRAARISVILWWVSAEAGLALQPIDHRPGEGGSAR